jgi:uncharacterized protein YdeI (YjbR/CyaY-like superfamily)
VAKQKSGVAETLMLATVAAWNAWLAKHHATSPGITMRIARKGSAAKSITYGEAVDTALVWGWIDGQKGSGDPEAWLQNFAPRKPRSIWSKNNREKASALIEAGKMKPAGLAAVDAAKANGCWDRAYDAPKQAKVPDDLAAALATQPAAGAFFATLDSRNRYAILHRLMTAKKPETRAKRIAQFVELCARREKIYP